MTRKTCSFLVLLSVKKISWNEVSPIDIIKLFPIKLMLMVSLASIAAIFTQTKVMSIEQHAQCEGEQASFFIRNFTSNTFLDHLYMPSEPSEGETDNNKLWK
jgi:hypothetical protein